MVKLMLELISFKNKNVFILKLQWKQTVKFRNIYKYKFCVASVIALMVVYSLMRHLFYSPYGCIVRCHTIIALIAV